MPPPRRAAPAAPQPPSPPTPAPIPLARPDPPASGRTRQRDSVTKGLLVAAVARPGPEQPVRRQHEQREPDDHAGAPGVEQPPRAREGQHRDRERAVERQPDARV